MSFLIALGNIENVFHVKTGKSKIIWKISGFVRNCSGVTKERNRGCRPASGDVGKAIAAKDVYVQLSPPNRALDVFNNLQIVRKPLVFNKLRLVHAKKARGSAFFHIFPPFSASPHGGRGDDLFRGAVLIR